MLRYTQFDIDYAMLLSFIHFNVNYATYTYVFLN